ncbi:hypothetical protein AB3G45_12755 [Shinella sp. S4-D37]|uniref:hypothetical protein n=1 Tax=Shinella sp. S4-D37 TaxID=3161999 RepID=UPI0034660BA8
MQYRRLPQELQPILRSLNLPLARQIEASWQKLTKLTEKLLQLARAEAGIGVSETTFDLVDVLDVVVTHFQRASHEASRIRLRNDLAGPALREGTADAFAIVLRNLMENALLHGRAEEPVEIHLAETGIPSIRNGAVRGGACGGAHALFPRPDACRGLRSQAFHRRAASGADARQPRPHIAHRRAC